MSGGKKKKSSSSGNKSSGGGKKSNIKEPVKDTFVEENKEDNSIKSSSIPATKSGKSATTSDSTNDAFATNPSVDVLDRLAPPILFFPPNVAEEYLNRFCPAPQSVPTSAEKSLLADEGFPDREIPVMRRLLAMMAGIMSKASAASARTYFSRVAGTEGRRNGYFQQNLNTSVFNLFSTLSAAGGTDISNTNEKDLHLKPGAAFTAKDGEPLRGYPSRLMKFWRQLSPTEQLRLVKEEHAALTNSWIESRQNWCLCVHCKHRRMTISDLTDCLYQTYCEELEAFLNSGGQGSTLYSPNLTNSVEPAAKARRFLFKSLSVVGEQALLPRYNQFILKLEAFSSMAFSMKDGCDAKTKKGSKSHKVKIPCDLKNGIKSGLKSAALQASKEFLHLHGKNATEIEEFMSEKFLPPTSENLKRMSKAFENPLEGLSIKLIHGSDDEDCVLLDQSVSSDSEISELGDSEYEDDENDRESHQGGIQSEDDDDLIDEETDLPIDESELMLPGGSSFPLLPVGDGPVQWSESSRIECGRTVFLMFASEMFQYRLTAAYLAHQTKLRQMKLLAEVEEEERLEKEKRAREEREKKEKKEAEKKRKAAKKEKAAAKANGKAAKKPQTSAVQVKKPVIESEGSETEIEVEVEPAAVVEKENLTNESNVTFEPVVDESIVEPVDEMAVAPETVVQPIVLEPEPEIKVSIPSPPPPLNISPLFPPVHQPPSAPLDDDDFDPNLLVEQLSKEMNRFELFSTTTNDKPNFSSTPSMSPPGFAPPPGFAVGEPKHLEEKAGEDVGYRYRSRPPFSLDYAEGYYGFERPAAGGYAHMQSQVQGQAQGYFHTQQSQQSQGYAYPLAQTQGYAHSSDNVHAHVNNHAHAHVNNHPQPPPHFIPSGYHHIPQPSYDPYKSYGYPTNYHLQPQMYPSQPSPGHYPQFNSGNPVYHRPPPHQPQEPEDEEGQSRFQSFFSKSIFGPSSFFSQ